MTQEMASKIKGIMSGYRCDYREACAILGRRAAKSRAAHNRSSRRTELSLRRHHEMMRRLHLD